MTYDSSTDALQDALAAMCIVEVTNALVGEFGDVALYPAIRETRRYPIPIEMIEAVRLPVMAIFVERELGQPLTMKSKDTRITFALDYTMGQTTLQNLERRWPALRKVWAQVLKSIRVGTANGVADALGLAGAQRVLEETATCTYDHATNGEQSYPHFLGRVDIVWREPSTSSLETLSSLFANINRVDGNPVLQPQVEVQVAVP